ncbi:MAG: cytochrome-c oxidase [Rhizobiales bacterium]|nr:cytochrome-c oxidase [Hyphomicrobiales bacterium]
MRLPALVALFLLAGAAPAAAHHPGDRLDEVMAEKESAFEPTDERRMPPLALTGADGASLDLSGLADRIVVLSFRPDGCDAPCADQQALLQEVLDAVNVTPMRDMVQFLTVGGDVAPDPDGEAANWRSVMPTNETVEAAAAAFAALSARGTDAPMVHVIGRGGRHAGIFHGAGFGRINLVLYINGLTNAPPPEPGLLDRLFGAFR